MTFKDLKVGDIFQADTEEYYIKIEPKNGFNAILLTNQEVDYNSFDDNIIVSKL